jgi:hypothetical protein
MEAVFEVDRATVRCIPNRPGLGSDMSLLEIKSLRESQSGLREVDRQVRINPNDTALWQNDSKERPGAIDLCR